MTRSWTTVASSVRGAAHTARARVNEDAIAAYESAAFTAVAVADGHGSDQSPRSAIGSRFAVDVAIELLAGASNELDDLPDPALESLGRVGTRIVASWRRRVAAHVSDHPFGGDEEHDLSGAPPEYAYGSTLLIGGCTRNVGFAMQLGDGHIVLVGSEGVGQLAFDPVQRHGTETDSLCTVDADERLKVRTWGIDGTHPMIVAASSDGWGDAFVDPLWFRDVGRQLHEHVLIRGPEHVRSELEGWLSRAAEEFGDDTSMAILIEVQPPRGATEPSDVDGRRVGCRRSEEVNDGP